MSEELYFISLQLSKRETGQTLNSMSQHWGYYLCEEEAIGDAVLRAAELKPGFSVDQYLVTKPDPDRYTTLIAALRAWKEARGDD
jgi:hypothetical protein